MGQSSCIYGRLPANHFLSMLHGMSNQIIKHYNNLNGDHLLNPWQEVFALHGCRARRRFSRELRLPAWPSGGFELLRQTLFLDGLRILSVPLCALSPVPLTLTRFLSTGHLAVFKSWIGTEPAFANAAWTFAAGHGLFHRCLSALSGWDNDSMRSVLASSK